MSAPGFSAREIRDHYGRRYRVGEEPHDLIGRPRAWMLWLCWAPMLAVGVLQYGYGAAVPAMAATRGQPVTEFFWLLAVWTVFQAGAGFPVAYLRQRDRVGPRTVMLAGAALCLGGVLALAHAPNLLALLIGYSVLSGTGAGLVYASCTSTIAKWYPERAAGRVSFVTGAFAYGSVPFILALMTVESGGLAAALDVFGLLLFLVVLGCGALITDPPRDWWPSHIDPRQWALSRQLNPGWLKNPPAVRQYSAAEALRSPVLHVMYACLFSAGTVSLFNAAFVVVFPIELGLSPWIATVAGSTFAGTNGAGRALAIHIADHVGRRRTLHWVLGVQAVGQFLLLMTAVEGSTAILLVASALTGAGGGAFYPLFAAVTREYFGEQRGAEVHGVVYSAKAFSGVAGVGLAALVVAQWGYPVAFLLAGCLSLFSAVLSRKLRRPGFPRTLPSPRPASP